MEESKEVFIVRHCVMSHLNARERNEFHETEKLINFLFFGLCFRQVSHHPPISACHAESRNFVFWQGNVLLYLTFIIFGNVADLFCSETAVHAC